MLRSSYTLHSWKNHKEIQIKLKLGEETPPEELIQMARIKVVPKIHVWIPKIPITECAHKKSGLEFFPYSKNFGKNQTVTWK